MGLLAQGIEQNRQNDWGDDISLHLSTELVISNLYENLPPKLKLRVHHKF